MKNYIFVTILLSVFFLSCKKDGGALNTDNKIDQSFNATFTITNNLTAKIGTQNNNCEMDLHIEKDGFFYSITVPYSSTVTKTINFSKSGIYDYHVNLIPYLMGKLRNPLPSGTCDIKNGTTINLVFNQHLE